MFANCPKKSLENQKSRIKVNISGLYALDALQTDDKQNSEFSDR